MMRSVASRSYPGAAISEIHVVIARAYGPTALVSCANNAAQKNVIPSVASTSERSRGTPQRRGENSSVVTGVPRLPFATLRVARDDNGALERSAAQRQIDVLGKARILMRKQRE